MVILIGIVAVILIALTDWLKENPTFIYLVIGGAIFIIMIWLTKKLARVTVKSPISFNKTRQSNDNRHNKDNDHESADLLKILKTQMHFPSSEAKDATEYVMEIIPNEPFIDKVKEALKYLDKGN